MVGVTGVLASGFGFLFFGLSSLDFLKWPAVVREDKDLVTHLEGKLGVGCDFLGIDALA